MSEISTPSTSLMLCGDTAASGIQYHATKLTYREFGRTESISARALLKQARTVPRAHPLPSTAPTASHRRRSPCWSTPLARYPSFRQWHLSYCQRTDGHLRLLLRKNSPEGACRR